MSRGATVVEVLLALVLLGFGVLALAATAQSVARAWHVAAGDAGMAARGAERVEMLLAWPRSAATGRSVGGGYEVEWRRDRAGDVDRLFVAVAYRWGDLRRGDTLFAGAGR